MAIITLVGPRSVGKSTVGKNLASSLGYKYVNTDEVMDKKWEKQGGIGKYTTKYGWDSYYKQLNNYFRRNLDSFKKEKGVILDCGGGTIYSEFPGSRLNAKLLKGNSKIVLILPDQDLEKGYEILFERERKRPHFKTWDPKKLKSKVVEDYKSRVPGMLEYADHVVHADQNSPEKLAKLIEACVNKSQNSKNPKR